MEEIGKINFRKVFTFITILCTIIKKFLTQRYDLCYIAITVTRSALYKDSVVVGLAKLFKQKIVYHLHNKGVKTRQDNIFNHFLYKRIFKNISVILLSKHLYPDIQKYVPEDKVYYCPDGVPEAANSQKIIKNENDPVEILFLSNMTESKGIYILLDACKMLKDKGYKFTCNFVGPWNSVTEHSFNNYVTKNRLNGHVIYKGKKYGKDKEQYFRRADIFAFPTFNDCFGLVLLEAMQFSLPVVSTYEGGIPDIVEDGVTGFLCPQKDVTALAGKLEMLIKDRFLRVQMGAAGNRKYKKEFTLENLENNLKSILISIIEAKSG